MRMISILLAGSMVAGSSTGCQQMSQTSGKGTIVNATLQTSKGIVELELYASDAPKTVANFVGLAEQGYFNGILFHRISKGFVVQSGDSTGTGRGGRSIYGGRFEDELFPHAPSYMTGYVRGTLAMANAGPNTNTSQFFIVLQDAQWLPKNYTIFGRVTSGMDVVDSIGAAPITPVMGPNDGKPVEDIVIKSVTIKK